MRNWWVFPKPVTYAVEVVLTSLLRSQLAIIACKVYTYIDINFDIRNYKQLCICRKLYNAGGLEKLCFIPIIIMFLQNYTDVSIIHIYVESIIVSKIDTCRPEGLC